MNRVSEAYVLASHIHEAFFDNTKVLTDEERIQLCISSGTGMSASKTSQRINARGDVNGRPAWQTLAKDKNGNFHLSTTYSEYGGKHDQTKIYPHSSIDGISTLMETVFMKKLVEIALRSP